MRVLITGAARAIGAATARVLTDEGCDVVATARDVSLLDDVPAVARLPLDITDEESVRACIAAAGEIDVVVNNAAIAEAGPLETYPLDRLRAAFETNVIGTLRVIQGVVPSMRDRGGGSIVNISSVQGRVGSPLEGSYCATKWAIEAMSETLHYELGHFGIRVVIIEPGFIAPGMKSAPRWGLDGPPYDDLAAQWFGTEGALLGDAGRPGPEIVGQMIWSALNAEEPRLRWPVGQDAELVLATRQALDDEAFEQAMRATLNLDW
jgi:NAD(P)-dependent dehydrogenase (short-subunit alcohol dehydrogenase family)